MDDLDRVGGKLYQNVHVHVDEVNEGAATSDMRAAGMGKGKLSTCRPRRGRMRRQRFIPNLKADSGQRVAR